MQITKNQIHINVTLDEQERYHLIRAILDFDKPHNVRRRVAGANEKGETVFDWVTETKTNGSQRLTITAG